MVRTEAPIRARLADRARTAWRRPSSLTSIVPMGGLSSTTLRERIAARVADLDRGVDGLAGLHSFRLVVVPGDPQGDDECALVLNAVHDQHVEWLLGRLVEAVGGVLVEVLAGAPDFSGSPDALPGLLMRHRRREQTLHLGAINKSVEDILAEDRLRHEIERFVDEELDAGNWDKTTSPELIRQATKEHVRVVLEGTGIPSGGSLPLRTGPRLLRTWSLLVTFAFPAIGVIAADIRARLTRIADVRRRTVAWIAYACWWIYGAIPTAMAMLVVRILEQTEPDHETREPDDRLVARLEATEDVRHKNELTLWMPVKPTWIRRFVLRVILFGSDRGCRHLWTDGRLTGIDTIHYARIMQVHRGRTMFFMSDYDGGLNRYLDDFLGAGSRAVIPITSNIDGCPKTRWLFGLADPETFSRRFKALIRLHQLEASFWYNAYPALTVTKVIDNSLLRAELFAETLTANEAQRWARRL